MPNQDLINARRNRNDEFYTQFEDIERELKHYRGHFKGKVVYCNCDDPRVSNFFRLFSKQFEFYGLKKLIATCYKNQQLQLFSNGNPERAVYAEYEGHEKIAVKHLQNDGDFRSQECINFLKQADIVVTNPPFSLFREYVAQLVKYDKKFLIIGNMNAITYKEIFPLFKENRMWYGSSISSGDREFGVPDNYPLTAASHRIDENGRKFIRVKGVRWFTNLPHKKRNEELILYKRYCPEEYPHYDNYDAIEVSKIKDIPKDWEGYMGVPITFLDKYNPEQFEIVGKMSTTRIDQYNFGYPYINGEIIYARIVIRNKRL